MMPSRTEINNQKHCFFQKLQKSEEMNCSEKKMLSLMEAFQEIVSKVFAFNGIAYSDDSLWTRCQGRDQ